MTVYVPRDASALSLGAEAVARAIRAEADERGLDLRIVRNGSRGMFWLEPLVEVERSGVRLAYGPVTSADVPGLFAAGFLDGGSHQLALGPTEEIPFFKNQERLTFARVGVIDPVDLDAYIAHGGYAGLAKALTMAPAEIVDGRHRVGTSRPRRGGLPDGHQVEDGARRAGDSEVRHLQRRRRRLRARSRTACSWKAIRTCSSRG